MTSDLLRRAAVRAQELADAATPGPWYSTEGTRRGTYGVLVEDSLGDWLGNVAKQTTDADAELIAACDPPFLRAVGEWLAVVADRYESLLDTFAPGSRAGAVTARENTLGFDSALTVARALLGESARITSPPPDSSPDMGDQ